MKFDAMRVLLTGATGGIGRVVAQRLLERGAHVLLVARDAAALASLQRSLAFAGERAQWHAADLTHADDRAALCARARDWHGGVNVLINNAGMNPFAMYADLTAAQIDAALAINLHAPMRLCHELLPALHARDAAIIVNIGSVLGAIGMPANAAYCATKFGLRGFTEALRRELADSRVAVKYLAPRATRTSMNAAVVEAMNVRLGVAMDSPERVAAELVALLERPAYAAVIGWPEKIFTRLNALLPALVDRALRRQLPHVRAAARIARPAPAQETTTHEHEIKAA